MITDAHLETTADTRRDGSASRGGLRSWPLDRRDLGRFAIAYVALSSVLVGVGLLLTRVLDDVPPFRSEAEVNRWFERHRTDRWNDISLVTSNMSDTRVKILLVLVTGAVFAIAWRRWNDSLQIAASLLLEVAVFGTVQQLVDRPRPPVQQLDGHLPTSSFPSGHVAATVAFYVGIAIVVYAHTRRAWLRSISVAIAVVIPMVMIVSRLYRGMHHVSDIAAGVTLGLAAAFVTRHIVGVTAAVGDPRPREAGDPAPATGRS